MKEMKLRSAKVQTQAHLHNHITHHTLALYSLGASPEQILQHTERNQTYQLQPPQLPDEKVIKAMGTPEGYKRYLGDEDYFLSFTAFFEREIANLGYEEVLQKYMFGGTEVADDLLARMYHGQSKTIHGALVTKRGQC
jgi:Questin oxidase-like